MTNKITSQHWEYYPCEIFITTNQEMIHLLKLPWASLLSWKISNQHFNHKGKKEKMPLLHVEGFERCTAAHVANIKMTKLVSSTGLFSSYLRWLHLTAPEQILEPGSPKCLQRSGEDLTVRNTAQAAHRTIYLSRNLQNLLSQRTNWADVGYFC